VPCLYVFQILFFKTECKGRIIFCIDKKISLKIAFPFLFLILHSSKTGHPVMAKVMLSGQKQHEKNE